jgi:predicted Zn-dependent peptidase
MSKIFSKQTLPNGARLILMPRAESPAVTVMVMAETGSKYEEKRASGLSHFFEHLAFKGTKRRPKASQISEEFDSMGANFNAFTSQEYTGYYATVAPKSFDRALDLLADMYQHSIFPPAEIEKERGVIIEEINMYEDLPMRSVEHLLMSTVYGDQPVGRPVLGFKETVSALKQEDFLAYRASNYSAPATIILVAGKFNEKQVASKVARQFAALPAGAKPQKPAVAEAQTAPRVALNFKKSDQTHILFGLRGYSATHPDHYVMEVLTAVLGGSMSSRLFKRIRDELGAAYYVRANNDPYTDHGLLEVAVGCDTRRAEEIVKVVVEELDRLRRQLVPEAELSRVKDSLTGSLFLDLETTSGLANFFAQAEILDGKLISPEAEVKNIRAVTAADIRRVAKKIIVPERLNLAMVGPLKDEAPFVDALGV